MRQTLLNAPPVHPGAVFDLVFANPPERCCARRPLSWPTSSWKGGAHDGVTMGKALNLALHDALARRSARADLRRGCRQARRRLPRDRRLARRVRRASVSSIRRWRRRPSPRSALGLAIKGFRPVAEMQFDAFSYPSFQQVTSNIAKYHTRTGGACPMQLVIRIPYGGNIGAIEQHSESPETYYIHTAGLKVVSPATPSGRLCAADGGDPRSRSGDLPGAEGALLEPAGDRPAVARRCRSTAHVWHARAPTRR